jgi:hypothetical protein
MAISRPQINRQLRKDGGILTIADARRMAPPGEDLAYINKDEAALLKSLGGAGEDINGTGIKSYFFKKAAKAVKKAVKKVVKSPIGKAALAAAAIKFGGPLMAKSFPTTFGSAAKSPFLRALGRGQFLGDTGILSAGKTALFGSQGVQGTSGLLGKLGLTKGGGSLGLTGLGKLATIGGVSGLAGLLAAKEAEDEEEIDFSKLDRGEGLDIADIVRRAKLQDSEFRFLPGAEFTEAYAADGGRIGKEEGGGVGSLAMNKENVPQMYVSDEAGALPKKMKDGEGGVLPSDMGKLKRSDFETEEDYKRYLRQLNKKAEGGPINLGMDLYLITKQTLEKEGYSPGEAHEKALDASGMREYFDKLPKEKNGGRIGKQEGGIMDLGGMEMDLRGGGFVPLGAKEKADDVPARLSKNEFVMTADAVRAAGGGSIDKGADKMYNLMKDLESRV